MCVSTPVSKVPSPHQTPVRYSIIFFDNKLNTITCMHDTIAV